MLSFLPFFGMALPLIGYPVIPIPATDSALGHYGTTVTHLGFLSGKIAFAAPVCTYLELYTCHQVYLPLCGRLETSRL